MAEELKQEPADSRERGYKQSPHHKELKKDKKKKDKKLKKSKGGPNNRGDDTGYRNKGD